MTAWLLLTDLDRARDFLRAGMVRTSGGRSAMLQLPCADDQVYLYICRQNNDSEAALDVVAYRGTFSDQSVSRTGRGGLALHACRSVEFDPTFRPLFAAPDALGIAAGPKWRLVKQRGMTSLPDQDAAYLDNYIDRHTNSEKGYFRDLQTHDLCLL